MTKKIERWRLDDKSMQDSDESTVLIVNRWFQVTVVQNDEDHSKTMEHHFFKEWDDGVKTLCEDVDMDGHDYFETFCQEGWSLIPNGRVEIHTIGMTVDGHVVPLRNLIEVVE